MNDNLQHSAGARRISWVDYGKGLAILLVFWGHAICPEPVRASFYAFHIPVFYFLSGYVFSTRKYHSFGPFLWHKVRTLIIPGLTFGFLIVFFKWLNGLIAGEAYSVNPLKLLIGVFVELRGGDYSVIPWFFVSIFIIELMAYWIFGLAKEHAGVLLSLALIASVVGYCYATFIGKIVLWSLETACTGFGFFVLGYLAKSPGKTWFASITRPAWLPLWLVVTAAGTWLNVTIAHQRLDVYMNEYRWYPFTMMGALGGIALVLGLLQLLEYHERTAAAKPVSSLLRYIGKNSFIFYSLNQVGLLIGEEILGACGIPLNNITWPWQLLWGGACIVIAVLLCVPMVEFTNRCFPQILGKPRRISAAS